MAFADDPYWPRYEGNSRTFLYWVRDRLNEAYPGTKVSSKEVAVRMMLSDLQVDLVPAFGRDAQGDGFYIPNGSGGWRQTNPLYHEYLINTSDKRLGQQLKPLIKVMKAWNIANGGHLKSFHLEMIVEKMWRDATALGSLPATIAETLRAAVTYVPNTFSDPWDAPQRIDDYLTSAERDLAVRLLKGDAVTAAEAVAAAAAGRQAEAVELWDRVFARKSAAFH